MLNKNWSSLNDEHKTGGLKRGFFGEYFAEMQFMIHGFEVYKTVVDDRGIDFIIRKPQRPFLEIQVKSVTGNTNIKINRDKFDIKNKHLYLLAIKWVDGKEPEMYIIPSERWGKHDNIFYDSELINKKTGKPHKEPQYGLFLSDKNCESLLQYQFEKYIEEIKRI